jgi:RNA 3'-terminal phosphate cyclase
MLWADYNSHAAGRRTGGRSGRPCPAGAAACCCENAEAEQKKTAVVDIHVVDSTTVPPTSLLR